MNKYKVTHKNDFLSQEGKEYQFIVCTKNALTPTSSVDMYLKGRGKTSLDLEEAKRFNTDQKAREAMYSREVQGLVRKGMIKDLSYFSVEKDDPVQLDLLKAG